MKSKKLKKAFAGLCTVALTVSSVPVSAQTEQTETLQKESGLRLWYDEPASKGKNIWNDRRRQYMAAADASYRQQFYGCKCVW